ncbi:MAG: carbonic anhydrase, partial [Bacteroidota bacterium]
CETGVMGKSVGHGEALDRLVEGNKRFANSQSYHQSVAEDARRQMAQGQRPFAVILTCADSRVPPSQIFDHGLGEVFSIRIAGNVPSDAVVGSIEFAVTHLGSRLVVVMGHEKCGAVQAAIEGERDAHLYAITDLIQPAVAKARAFEGNLLENCIRVHATMVAENLRHQGPVLSKACQEGSLKVVPAYYRFETGVVEFLEGLL